MTTYYVRPTFTGTHTGVNWTNAYSGMPTSLTRGDTYVIAGGAYGNYNFDDTGDITEASRITIRKASKASSGYGYSDDAIAGWNDTYESTQAVFNNVDMTRGYYTVDGVTPSTLWATTGHGIKITPANPNTTNHTFVYTHSGTTPTQVRMRRVAWVGPGENANENMAIWGQQYGATYFTFEGCYFTAYQQFLRMDGPAINNFVFEYCYIDTNVVGGSNHGETVAFWQGTHTHTIRYCFLNSYTSTGCIMAGGDGKYETAMSFYGNVFYRMGLNNTGNGTLGTMDSGQTSHLDDWKIYNNTFIDGEVLICRPSGGSGNNWDMRNNLFYNLTADYSFSAPSGTWDYNAKKAVSWGWPVGGHDLTLTESMAALFPNFADGNYRLGSASQARNAGVALASPYNLDPDGNVRGADGTFDIGAFEYAAGGTPPVGTPVLSVR